MKKLLFAFLFLTAPAFAVYPAICYDTLRPNANGGFNNWDDCNTAGCAATASNYLRVNTSATTATIATDVDLVCLLGNVLTSHHVANFTRTHVSIDTVRIRVKLWGTVATDSCRIGMMVGTDTIWTARFVLTTTPTFYTFTSHTDPHGNGWENAPLDSLEICVSPKAATLGRIFDTEEMAEVVFWGGCGGDAVSANDQFMITQGVFGAATSTGTQTIDTGVDSVLRAIRLYGSQQTAEGYGEEQVNWMGIGADSAFSGTIKQKGLGWANDDFVATTNAGRWSADSILLILGTGAPTIQGAAMLDSFGHGGNAGKFYLNWTDAADVAHKIYYEAYYGGSLTNVNVTEHKQDSIANSNKSFTGIGFQPQILFTMASTQTAKGSGAHSPVGFGYAVSATQQGAVSVVGIDADATGPAVVNRMRQNTDLFAASYRVAGAQGPDLALQFISFDENGFTAKVIARQTNNVLFWVLSLRGGNHQVGNFNSPTAGGTPQDQSITTTFVPAGAAFLSCWGTTLNANIAEEKLAFGCGSDSTGTITNQVVETINDDLTGLGTETVTGMSNSSARCIRFSTVGSPPALSVDADYKTETATNFTVTWQTITATAHKVFYWAFGPGPTVAGAASPRRRRILLTSEKELEEDSEKAPFIDGLACRFIR